MALTGIRSFIEGLKAQGDLISISASLDPKYEISAVLSEIGKKEAPAILFEKVKGHRLSVLSNLLGTRERHGRFREVPGLALTSYASLNCLPLYVYSSGALMGVMELLYVPRRRTFQTRRSPFSRPSPG